jgi:hypothetical protein
MWRFRHLIVILSLVALGYYFSITFEADWKVLVPMGIVLLLTYLGASLADPLGPPDDPGSGPAAPPA